MFGDAAADHEGGRFLGREDEVGELRFVPQLVNRKRLVLLPERPELVPDRPIENRGHDNGNAVLPRPPEQRLTASGAPAELPKQFARGRRPEAGVPQVAQHRLDFLLQDDAVRRVRDEDVPEAVHSETMQGDVVHFEVAMVVRLPHPREIVIGGAARRHHDVDEPLLDEGAQDTADPGGHEGGGEREEGRAGRSAEHGPEYLDANGDFLRREAASTTHRFDESRDLRRRGHVDVLDLPPEEVALRHPRGILGTR